MAAILVNIGSIGGSVLSSSLASRKGWIIPSISALALATLLIQAALVASSSVSMLLGILLFLAVAHKACGISADTVLVRASSLQAIRFERIRLWGSVGFIVVSYTFGFALDAFGERSLSWVALAVAIPLFVSAFGLSRAWSSSRYSLLTSELGPGHSEHAPSRENTAESERVAWKMSLTLLLLACGLMWASSGVLYVFLSVYLRHLGWSGTAISTAWAIGILAEILMFMNFNFVERRFSLQTIFRVSILAGALRWALMTISPSPYVILSAQLLHSLSFAAFYLSSVKLVYAILPAHLKDRGQGYLGAFGSGLGSLIGRILTGVMVITFDGLDGVPHMFAVATVIALVAYGVSGLLRASRR